MRIAFQSGRVLYFRWPYQAAVIKIFERVKRKIVAMVFVYLPRESKNYLDPEDEFEGDEFALIKRGRPFFPVGTK